MPVLATNPRAQGPVRPAVEPGGRPGADASPAAAGKASRTFLRLACLDGVELIRGEIREACFPVHSHDEYSLVAVESGHARFLCGRHVCEARPGTLILIEPGLPHTGGSADGQPVRYRTFQVAAEVFNRVIPGRSLPTFPVKVVTDPDLAAAFLAVHARLLETGADRCAELASLLAEIVRRHAAAAGAAPEQREPRRIRIVREHLAANLTQTASLDDLSDLVGVSPFYLQRTFKAATRMSPREYQMDLRIRRARQLLREGLPPRTVAAMVGFFDQSHFTRAFRKLTGVTPGQYAARPGRDQHPLQQRPGAA